MILLAFLHLSEMYVKLTFISVFNIKVFGVLFSNLVMFL